MRSLLLTLVSLSLLACLSLFAEEAKEPVKEVTTLLGRKVDLAFAEKLSRMNREQAIAEVAAKGVRILYFTNKKIAVHPGFELSVEEEEALLQVLLGPGNFAKAYFFAKGAFLEKGETKCSEASIVLTPLADAGYVLSHEWLHYQMSTMAPPKIGKFSLQSRTSLSKAIHEIRKGLDQIEETQNWNALAGAAARIHHAQSLLTLSVSAEELENHFVLFEHRVGPLFREDLFLCTQSLQSAWDDMERRQEELRRIGMRIKLDPQVAEIVAAQKRIKQNIKNLAAILSDGVRKNMGMKGYEFWRKTSLVAEFYQRLEDSK